MTAEKYPDEEKLRVAAIERAEEYCLLTGNGIGKLGILISNDKTTFTRLKKGKNFTIGLYRKIMDWLDENWPKEPVDKKAAEREQVRA